MSTRSSLHNSIRSKTSSGSRVPAASSMWDEFNQTTDKPSTPSQKFLEKKGEDPNFVRLHQRVLRDLKYTDMDIAASIIQNCWKKYRIKSYFLAFIRKYKAIHQRSYSSFFYNLAIQRMTDPEKRKKFFDIIARRLLWGRKLSRDYHMLTYDQWNVCNLYLVPNFIDDQKLVQFVRKIYYQKMRTMLLDWFIITRRNAKRRKVMSNFHIVNANRSELKQLYVPFILWKFITKNVYFDRTEYTHIPEIQNYNQSLINQEKIRKNADKQHLFFVGKRVLQALFQKKLQKYHDREQEKFGDEYNLKRCMKYACKAWIRTVSVRKDMIKTKTLALSKWHNVVNSKQQLQKLLKMFEERHKVYLKLFMLNVFKKNLQINTILHTHGYIKIQALPSLARFFVHAVAGNDTLACLSSALYGWLTYVRRRKNWQQFVAANIQSTNYNHTKGKALAALRFRRYPPLPYGFVAPHFQMQTYKIYKAAVNHQISPFLILSNPESSDIEEKIKNAKTKYERREMFFMAWKSTKQDLSLFMRIALVANARARDFKKRTELLVDERMMKSYERSLLTLKSLNLASKENFEKVQLEIKKNNEKALRNSTASIRRMMMLITALDSHQAAIDLEKLDPFFRTVKNVTLVDDVQKASEQLSTVYTPLTDIAAMGRSFPEFKGEISNFERLTVHKSGFDKQYEEMKVIIFIEKKRSMATQAATSHFSNILNRNDSTIENAAKNATSTKITTFAKNYTEDVSIKKGDGTIDKYSKMFPQYGNKRKLRVSMSKSFQLDDKNQKEEESDDEFIGLKISRDSTKATLSSDSLSRSSFFNIGGFENALKASAAKMLEIKKDERPDNQMPQIDEMSSESEEDFIEENIPQKSDTKSDIKKVTKQNSKKINFGDGFDDTIMRSALKSNDFDDPDVNNRYKTFLQIMFGKQGKDSPNAIQIQQIKRKIIQDYKNRKWAAPGIITQGVNRPVSSVVESYRRDRKKLNREFTSEKLTTKNKILSDKEMPKEYETKYNSKKYYTNSDFSDNDENEEEDEENSQNQEEEDKSDKNRQSFVNTFKDDDRFQQERMKEKEELESESDEDIINDKNSQDDTQIDAAAQQITKSDDFNVTSDYIPGVGYTIKDEEGNVIGYDPTGKSATSNPDEKIVKKFIDNGVALKSVNKVVHHIINEMARTESEISFVEVDSLGPPELDLSQLIPPKEEEPPKPPEKQSEPPKKKWTKHGPPPKSRRPIVIPRMQTIKPSMAKFLFDDDNMTKIIYDEGGVTRIEGEMRPPEQPREKKKWFPGVPDHHVSYFVEDQVVSFPGGGRQISGKPHDFTSPRINSVKNRGITKPIVSMNNRPLTATKIEKKKTNYKDPLDVVRGTLIHLTSMMENNDKEIYKKFTHRVRSMNKRPPPPKKIGDPQSDIKTVEFSDFIQNIYVRLSKDHDTETAANTLISTARQHQSFLPVLQKTVSRMFARPKTTLAKAEMPRVNDQPNTKSTAKFIDISWYTEDPYYKAVALQFADDNSTLNAVIAPTFENTPKKRSARPSTSMDKRKTWDDVLKDYSLGDMMLVTPVVK